MSGIERPHDRRYCKRGSGAGTTSSVRWSTGSTRRGSWHVFRGSRRPGGLEDELWFTSRRTFHSFDATLGLESDAVPGERVELWVTADQGAPMTYMASAHDQASIKMTIGYPHTLRIHVVKKLANDEKTDAGTAVLGAYPAIAGLSILLLLAGNIGA
jgi:hypothetical protein